MTEGHEVDVSKQGQLSGLMKLPESRSESVISCTETHACEELLETRLGGNKILVILLHCM